MKEIPSFEYQLYSDNWQAIIRTDRNGKGVTQVVEVILGVDSKPVEATFRLTEEQRKQLPRFIGSLVLGPADMLKRSSSTRAVFVSAQQGAAWTETELLAGAPLEMRCLIENLGHPAYLAAEVALRRGEMAEDKSKYEFAARAYRDALDRLASWWMPKGLRNDTNVTYQIAVQAEEVGRYAEASVGFLKVLKIRMEVYRKKYLM